MNSVDALAYAIEHVQHKRHKRHHDDAQALAAWQEHQAALETLGALRELIKDSYSSLEGDRRD